MQYLRRLLEHAAARIMGVELQDRRIRHEMTQRRLGFQLMAELAVATEQDFDSDAAFDSVSRRLNSTLNMQRTAILVPEEGNIFRPGAMSGYHGDEKEAVLTRRMEIPAESLDPLCPIVITGTDSVERLASIREALALPFFILSPVLVGEKVAAVIVTGRLVEETPCRPRLGTSDVETVQMVANYLSARITKSCLTEAESQAKSDTLTGLPNLRGANEFLHYALAIARRNGLPMAVLFLDLDNFKEINDTYGHRAGDMILRGVAERLKQNMRESDFAGRIGGDEFLIVLSQLAHPEDAGLVARNIIERITRPIAMGKESCKVGVSIGIAVYPDHGDDEASLREAADEAMYFVKRRGKNSFAFAAPAKKTRRRPVHGKELTAPLTVSPAGERTDSISR
jgi:diguanylate cyclase (GGDEF)-like protein